MGRRAKVFNNWHAEWANVGSPSRRTLLLWALGMYPSLHSVVKHRGAFVTPTRFSSNILTSATHIARKT